MPPASRKHLGCKANAKTEWAIAEISYGPNRRARTVNFGADPESKEPCRRAARALFLSASPIDVDLATAGTESEVVLLSLDRDRLTCMEEASRLVASRADSAAVAQGPSDGRAMHVRDGLREPRKLNQVNPQYPPLARQQRIQGMVILETTISRSGCVGPIRALAGPPELIPAAIGAVSQWAYTPTLLHGEPVPVIMTVTVNFTLE